MPQNLTDTQKLYLDMKKLGDYISQRPEFENYDVTVLISPRGNTRKVSVDCSNNLKRSLGVEMQFASCDITGLKKI